MKRNHDPFYPDSFFREDQDPELDDGMTEDDWDSIGGDIKFHRKNEEE